MEMAMSQQPAGDDTVVIEHETVDRLANIVVTVVPGRPPGPRDLAGVGRRAALAGPRGARDQLQRHRRGDHGRLSPPVHPPQLQDQSSAARAVCRVRSAAVEGPVIEWVSTHRKHHRFSDLAGDPHSPHTDHGAGWRGALAGSLHAHVGWMFRGVDRASAERYAKDLLADPVIRAVDRTFLLWVMLGLAFPFGLGVALTGSVVGGLTGMLWGGAVRILFLHHATFSINSLCHFFGRRRFATGDQSRNLAWLALPTFGEAWHNNHHAFPTSAHHGLTRWQLDPGGWLIDGLERVGLAWDVVRITPSAQQAKLASKP